MRKLIVLVLVISVLIFSASCQNRTEEKHGEVLIVFSNDRWAEFDPCGCKNKDLGGLAKICFWRC